MPGFTNASPHSLECRQLLRTLWCASCWSSGEVGVVSSRARPWAEGYPSRASGAFSCAVERLSRVGGSTAAGKDLDSQQVSPGCRSSPGQKANLCMPSEVREVREVRVLCRVLMGDAGSRNLDQGQKNKTQLTSKTAVSLPIQMAPLELCTEPRFPFLMARCECLNF